MTFLAPQLFKIEGGKIREIEGLSWAVPLGCRPHRNSAGIPA